MKNIFRSLVFLSICLFILTVGTSHIIRGILMMETGGDLGHAISAFVVGIVMIFAGVLLGLSKL